MTVCVHLRNRSQVISLQVWNEAGVGCSVYASRSGNLGFLVQAFRQDLGFCNFGSDPENVDDSRLGLLGSGLILMPDPKQLPVPTKSCP